MIFLNLFIFFITSLSSTFKINQEIIWTKDHKLVWTDFKAKSKPVEGADVAAVTRCGLSMQSNRVTAHQKPVFYVQAVFYKDQSWYRKDIPMTEAILNHEQKHFDLCEVYARQLRQQFRKTNLNAQNLTKEADRIFNKVNGDYLDRQTQYDKETRHGQEASEQTKWNELIAKELATLEEYSE